MDPAAAQGWLRPWRAQHAPGCGAAGPRELHAQAPGTRLLKNSPPAAVGFTPALPVPSGCSQRSRLRGSPSAGPWTLPEAGKSPPVRLSSCPRTAREGRKGTGRVPRAALELFTGSLKAPFPWEEPGVVQAAGGRKGRALQGCGALNTRGPSTASCCFSVHPRQGQFCSQNKAAASLPAGGAGAGLITRARAGRGGSPHPPALRQPSASQRVPPSTEHPRPSRTPEPESRNSPFTSPSAGSGSSITPRACWPPGKPRACLTFTLPAPKAGTGAQNKRGFF